jgi:hypothetical protein
MDDTTRFILDQTDEDVLTYTASDEALETAAGKKMADTYNPNFPHSAYTSNCC